MTKERLKRYRDLMREEAQLEAELLERINSSGIGGDSCLKIEELYYCMDWLCYSKYGGNEADFEKDVDEYGVWYMYYDCT